MNLQTLHEIPRRLATRVRHLEALPFIVGTNPYVATTLNAYRESFKLLATYHPVTNLEQNETFVAELEALVQGHANDIPTMAKGYVSTLDLFVGKSVYIRISGSLGQLPGMFQIYVSRSNQSLLGRRYPQSNICTINCRAAYSFVPGIKEFLRRIRHQPQRNRECDVLALRYGANLWLICRRIV
jgi:hypothetical protein